MSTASTRIGEVTMVDCKPAGAFHVALGHKWCSLKKFITEARRHAAGVPVPHLQSQIRGPHHLISEQILGRVCHHDRSVLYDVAPVGNAEPTHDVLLHDEHGDTGT